MSVAVFMPGVPSTIPIYLSLTPFPLFMPISTRQQRSVFDPLFYANIIKGIYLGEDEK
jgi:hypothetical protein